MQYSFKSTLTITAPHIPECLSTTFKQRASTSCIRQPDRAIGHDDNMVTQTVSFSQNIGWMEVKMEGFPLSDEKSSSVFRSRNITRAHTHAYNMHSCVNAH